MFRRTYTLCSVVSFVTFDSTSGASGKATPRIFVGVASVGTPNVIVSNDGGYPFSSIAGANTSWVPHKGVLSPGEKSLYISTADGAGPYDGTLGGVYKYNITSGTTKILLQCRAEIFTSGLTVSTLTRRNLAPSWSLRLARGGQMRTSSVPSTVEQHVPVAGNGSLTLS